MRSDGLDGYSLVFGSAFITDLDDSLSQAFREGRVRLYTLPTDGSDEAPTTLLGHDTTDILHFHGTSCFLAYLREQGGPDWVESGLNSYVDVASSWVAADGLTYYPTVDVIDLDFGDDDPASLVCAHDDEALFDPEDLEPADDDDEDGGGLT